MTYPYGLGDPGYLAWQPIIEPLILETGQTLVQTISPSGTAVFPSGTTVVLQFWTSSGAAGGQSLGSFAGTVAPTSVSWVIANGDVDTIPANSQYTIQVTYPTSPATTYTWFKGPVIRP